MDSDDNDTSINRRSSLAISALLNEDSIDPVLSPSTRLLTPEEKRENRKTWHGFITDEAPKAKRKRISTEQLNRLMDIFQQTDTPSSEVREHLAEELGMTKREVQVWFQNRRAKASRARVIAATGSNFNHSGPAPSSVVPVIRTHYPTNIMPPPLQPSITNNSHHQPPHPIITYTPPTSRRSSNVFSDPSSVPLAQSSSSSLQPIAPMPPSIIIPPPPPFTSAYNTPAPLTPPSYVQPIAPKNHNDHQSHHQGLEDIAIQRRRNAQKPTNKRPKSVIGIVNSGLQ